MIKPTLPLNESERQLALDTLRLKDAPEPEYDQIAELVAHICDKPIALITLIDKDKQWFKAKVGIDVQENTRDLSICGHALNDPYDILEIPDTRLDSRFQDNPVVSNDKEPIIFYAGVPLTNKDGLPLGTICVIDGKPGQLSNEQRKYLNYLANQVVQLFELRLKNNELENSEKELQKHNSSLKEFAGKVSHDLKMPLANITLTIDLMKSKYRDKLNEQALEYLDYLKQSSFTMNDYISGMLVYYQTDVMANEDQEKKEFDIHDLLEDIVDLLNIQDDIEINLPDKNIDLYCNKMALEQIFLNLVGNSLKYSDKDRNTVIDICCDEFKKHYSFQVKDNGVGIPEEKLSQIFELFSTATEKDRYGKKGNGIGLSTVQKLVKKLGGEIEVFSETGKGTTFKFTILKKKVCKENS